MTRPILPTIRVFPSRTRATPVDARAFVGDPPLWLHESDVQDVAISCTFTWDRPEAERLVKAWKFRFPEARVDLGGPAYGDPGGQFDPGMFLRPGYIITSRGCPNSCPRCMVPGREGGLRLLRIRHGWDVLDNNLLACPEHHIQAVCRMLASQIGVRFTGGLEAHRFRGDVAREILGTKPDRLFFAWDAPGDGRDVWEAVSLTSRITSWSAGALRHHVGCYVLMGYEGDTVEHAERRVRQVIKMNARAYPMFFRDENYSRRPPEWHDLVGGVLAMGGAR